MKNDFNFSAKKGHHGFSQGEPEFLRGCFTLESGDEVDFECFFPKTLDDYGMVFLHAFSGETLSAKLTPIQCGRLNLDTFSFDSHCEATGPGSDIYRIQNNLGDVEMEFLEKKFNDFRLQ